jgi:hypothetical protein
MESKVRKEFAIVNKIKNQLPKIAIAATQSAVGNPDLIAQ